MQTNYDDLYIIESTRDVDGKPIRHIRFVYHYSTAITYALELERKNAIDIKIKHYKFCCDISYRSNEVH
jgi:hypothetical protein